MRIHHLRKRDERVTRHDAVGIEHDCIVIGPAPRLHEVSDVAGLAPQILLAASVKDTSLRFVALHESRPRKLLRRADLGLARVREHEQIERRLFRTRLERGPNNIEASEHPRRVLVIDRHDDRGPPLERPTFTFGGMDHRGIAANELNNEAGHGRPESAGNPREQHEEDDEAGFFPGREAVGAQDVRHQGAGRQGGEKSQTEEQHPAPDGRPSQAVTCHGCAPGAQR